MKFVLMGILAYSLIACSTPKDIAYFQGGNDLREEQITQMKNYIDPMIKEGDVLTIAVSSTDPLAVAPFNLPLVSFVKEGIVIGSSGSATGTGTKDIGASQAMQTYTVNVSGYINFPILGNIKISGMRKQDAIQLLQEKLKAYVKDPIVNLNIINYKITVLGEVRIPGSYTIGTDRVSILDALGYAGDMTIYGDRTNVKVIRDLNGKKQIFVFDLTRSDFLVDPNFYLQQNDVLYIEPNNKRKKGSQYSETEQFKLSVVTATASIISVVASVIVSIVSISK
ncbi:polysaccharide biosynthesis/export family protein [Parabacteroides sp. Marseille-P3160]|uniref:polysaccharide biosynthesis/export family protein n=1 Tax=Parabacteroides sp. Marseille-P3160 TaxID=1917887 RepID=UPI000B416E2F|nr:polysaccharide biosynthesis/export family protein [Parabacteroides sp. Marseille-P3160]